MTTGATEEAVDTGMTLAEGAAAAEAGEVDMEHPDLEDELEDFKLEIRSNMMSFIL
jgi:hypothetical protein